MKFGLYPVKEWGWLWIGLSILLPLVGSLLDHSWPDPFIWLMSVIGVLFGVFAAPALERMKRDALNK